MTVVGDGGRGANFDDVGALGAHTPAMREFAPAVYILASRRNGTLYTGVTSDLPGRIGEHRQGFGSKFTSKYKVHQLVWFEMVDTMDGAIAREKQIKAWRRAWKLALIEKENPHWRDLFETLF
jgi:putative endonuclease